MALSRSVIDALEVSQFATFYKENKYFDLVFQYQDYDLRLSFKPVAGQYLIYSEGELCGKWKINLDQDRTNYSANKMFFLVGMLKLLDELIYDWYVYIITNNQVEIDEVSFLLNLETNIVSTSTES